MEKLRKRHKKHILVYDPRQERDNERRSTGAFLSPKLEDSVRIPKVVANEGQKTCLQL